MKFGIFTMSKALSRQVPFSPQTPTAIKAIAPPQESNTSPKALVEEPLRRPPLAQDLQVHPVARSRAKVLCPSRPEVRARVVSSAEEPGTRREHAPLLPRQLRARDSPSLPARGNVQSAAMFSLALRVSRHQQSSPPATARWHFRVLPLFMPPPCHRDRRRRQ